MAQEKRKVITKREVVVALPVVNAPHWLQGFVNFVREQGVVGLAVGLTLGVAAKGVVDSIVANIFNPLIGLLSGGENLALKSVCIQHDQVGNCVNKIGYGAVISQLISFISVAAIIYFVVKGLKLDKLDKPKAK